MFVIIYSGLSLLLNTVYYCFWFVANIQECQAIDNEKCQETETQIQTGVPVSESSASASNFDQLVISAVQKKTKLWKPNEVCKTPAECLQVWEEVCKEISLPTSERKRVKEAWTKLRGKYMKARKTYNQYTTSQSGMAAKAKGEKFRSGFIYFDEMAFLSDVVDVPR